MKLRIHGNSLRFRLSRSDVEQLRHTGICTESLPFGPDSQLTYRLEATPRVALIEVEYRQDCIGVLLPLDIAQQWAGSGQISLALDRSDRGGPSLLIEKDFQCLHREETSPSDSADTFPNPSAGDRRPAGL